MVRNIAMRLAGIIVALSLVLDAAGASAPTDDKVEPLPGPVLYADSHEIYDALLSPDGTRLVTSSEEVAGRPEAHQGKHPALALWDVASGELLRRASAKAADAMPAELSVRVKHLGWGPDGKTVLAYLGTRHLEVFSYPDLVSLGSVDVKKSASHWYRSARFSPDGAWLALGDEKGEVALWSVAERKLVKVWQAHDEVVEVLEFSPDSKTLATGSADDTVRLWAVSTSKHIKKISWKDGPPTALAFSPDGKWLAIGSRMKGKFAEARVWSLQRGKFAFTRPCAVLLPVVALAFSPDSAKLALGCSIGFQGEYHGILDVIALPGGQLLAQDQRFAVINQLRYLPDGRLLTRYSRIYRSRSEDRNEQSIGIWRMDPLTFSHYLSDPAARP